MLGKERFLHEQHSTERLVADDEGRVLDFRGAWCCGLRSIDFLCRHRAERRRKGRVRHALESRWKRFVDGFLALAEEASGVAAREILAVTTDEPKAQQGARANDHGCHVSCLRRSRASHGRGSSLTLGKKLSHVTTSELHIFNAIYAVVLIVTAVLTRATWRRLVGALAGGLAIGVVALAIIAFGEAGA